MQKTGGVVRESLTERVSEIKKVIKQLRQGKKFVDTEIALMQHALKTMAAFVDNAFVFPINANSECKCALCVYTLSKKKHERERARECAGGTFPWFELPPSLP